MAAVAVEGAVEGNVKYFVSVCVWYGICLFKCKTEYPTGTQIYHLLQHLTPFTTLRFFTYNYSTTTQLNSQPNQQQAVYSA